MEGSSDNNNSNQRANEVVISSTHDPVPRHASQSHSDTTRIQDSVEAGAPPGPWGKLVFNDKSMPAAELFHDTVYFGRKSTNHVVIKHPAISGVHGRITIKEEGIVMLKDLSTNGTYVNGRLVRG